MKILAIDTSSIVATCAILDDEKLLAEYILNHKKTHSQKIMPIVEEIMLSCELKPKDIDVYAVAKGPGSYTGLRIGVAIIKTLAQVNDKPVVGVPTLDALAFNMPYCEGVIVPIIDARRDRVFTGIYKWDSGNFYAIQQQTVMELEELLNILKDRNERIIFNGDGTLVYREKIVEVLKDKVLFAPSSVNMARASSVAQLAMLRAREGKLESYLELVPDYITKSQAQREYEERIKQNGGETK